jgi:hypothetical protein
LCHCRNVSFFQGCAVMCPDGTLSSNRDVTKQLMDQEAQRTAVDLLGVTFDPKESELINTKQVNSWIRKNKIDVKKFPAKVQKAIDDGSGLALHIPQFIPIKNQKAAVRSYDIGGIYLALFIEDIGGWWVPGGGSDCDVRCERCRGCTGPNNFCYCAYICCTRCDRNECWPCVPCANNP